MTNISELNQALQVQAEAAAIRQDALLVRILALELETAHLRQAIRGHKFKTANTPAPVVSITEAQEENEAEPAEVEEEAPRRREKSPILKLELPLQVALEEAFGEEKLSRPSMKRMKGIMLCLFDQEQATLEELTEYVGGQVAALRRHVNRLVDVGMVVQVPDTGHKLVFTLGEKGQLLFKRMREPLLAFK